MVILIFVHLDQKGRALATTAITRNRRFKQWHQLFHENMAFQQVENLCEEQIETLQEFRDEIVENYHHVIERRRIVLKTFY